MNDPKGFTFNADLVRYCFSHKTLVVTDDINRTYDLTLVSIFKMKDNSNFLFSHQTYIFDKVLL